MTEAEFSAWAAGGEHHVRVIRVADKFGDSGLTGIVSLEYRCSRISGSGRG